VSLADGEDWLWRPAAEGLIRFESIANSDVDLEAIAIANDILTVRAENERRYREAQKP
jgi:hypothetical protein